MKRDEPEVEGRLMLEEEVWAALARGGPRPHPQEGRPPRPPRPVGTSPAVRLSSGSVSNKHKAVLFHVAHFVAVSTREKRPTVMGFMTHFMALSTQGFATTFTGLSMEIEPQYI